MNVLDRDQLCSITLDDEQLMRDIVAALIEDTTNQLPSLDAAFHAADANRVARLAHYSKGACANVGAESVAATLRTIERDALAGDLSGGAASLAALAAELDRLRDAAATL